MAHVLRTERLVVRELEPEDLPFVTLMLTDPVNMRYWPRPYTPAEAAEWIERHRRRYIEDGCGYWLLSTRDGEPVGQVGVLKQEFEAPWLGPGPHWGLGYILHHPFCRFGYATEAATACVDWALRELNAPYVEALIRPENEASLNVARRLAMCMSGKIVYSGFDHFVYVNTTRLPLKHRPSDA